MIKTVQTYILLMLIILTVGIFSPTTLPALANPPISAQAQPVTVNLTGTIKKLAIEGTCYQLAADDGKKYELMGKFPKTDGTKVRVSGVVVTDMATICQVGQPLKVKTVRVIK